jgi:hypothetical protein
VKENTYMGTANKKIIHSLKGAEIRQAWGLLPSSKLAVRRSGIEAIRPAMSFGQRNEETGRLLSQGRHTSELSMSRTLSATRLSDRVLGQTPNAPRNKEEYVDPILFEMGIFANKQHHHAATDALVARIKSGEIQPRTPELEE